jgi:hypothetical protein
MSNHGPCQFIQDEIDRLLEDIIALEEMLAQGEVPPFQRPQIIAYIARLRTELQRKEHELQACEGDPSQYLLRLDRMEVTQALQDLSHNVPLIAGKTTVVRVYLSYSASPGVTVGGEIMVWRSSPATGVMIPSFNTADLDPALAGNVTAKRLDAALSLNFVLPKDQTAAGGLKISLAGVTNTTTGTPIPVARKSTLTVQFQASPPIRIRILGMRYTGGTPPATHVPSDLDFGLLVSWLRRAYPVAEVISSQAIIDTTATPPFSCVQVNAQIAAIRTLDMSAGADQHTHYYGLVSDGGFFMRGCAAGIPSTPDPSTVASGPTGPAAWGWDFDGSYSDWMGGHELGHTFGRLHPGFCGESHDDPSYPYANGQLASSDTSFVGFDVGDPAFNLPMAALPGTTWHDIMTYCNFQWLSAYTYEGIRTRLIAEHSQGASPGSSLVSSGGSGGRPDERFPDRVAAETRIGAGQTLISVVATVNLTRSHGKIDFVNPLPQGQVSQIVQNSPVILRVKRADGQLLHEYPVGVKPSSCTSPGEDRLALVDATIAVDPDAKLIELVVTGQVIDTFRASATPPAVRGLRRADAEPGKLAVAWGTDPQIDDKHTYSVQVSTDRGKTWLTVAVGLTKPEFTIDRNQFPGVAEVQMRVIATDGFTRSLVTSETFQVGG